MLRVVVAFRDGLGDRRLSKDSAGADVETLYLRRELGIVSSFEFGVRERADRLSGFRHAYYGRVRGVERTNDPDQALTISSDAIQGTRLSTLLDTAHHRRLPVNIDVALYLIRQLVPAVTILHESAQDAAHGALGPERLIVTPNGRLVIVEYVLGSGLEQLLFSRERYWTELRVALPRTAGLPRFDHSADVTQIGVVALSLILGRTLRDDEYPARIGEMVSSATAVSAQGGAEPLPLGLQGWLNRALQLDSRHSFPSAIEARTELEKVLADCGCEASPESLEKFLAQYHASDRKAVVSSASPEIKRPTERSPAAAQTPEDRPDAACSDVPDLTTQVYRPPNTHPPLRGRLATAAAAVVVVLAVLVGAALVGAPRLLSHDPLPIVSGTLAVTTNPAGAETLVDGVRRGTTPLTLTLPAGSHKVELRGHGEPRIIPVTIAPGAQVTQYVDLPKPLSPSEARLEIPPDGLTPLSAPGTADASPLPGWIAMAGNLEVQLYEAGRLLGSSRIERIMIPAGRHDLELVNELIGYRGTRTIQVMPGRVSTVTIDPPKTAIAINAVPWAEVWIDGEKAGDTPIGNFAVAAGSHDVVFRHPDLGEQRETVLVTLKTPVRLSVDMRKP
jgi:serine/threonine protein kinase